MQASHTTNVIQKLDQQQYNEEDLIEIRVPVSLPYQTDWGSFIRKDGTIEVNGIQYNYVLVKLSGGEMIYKCLPDMDRTHLVNARDNFFSLVNDLQTEKPSSGKPGAKNFKTFSFEFCKSRETFQFEKNIIAVNISYNIIPQENWQNHIVSPLTQPPSFS